MVREINIHQNALGLRKPDMGKFDIGETVRWIFQGSLIVTAIDVITDIAEYIDPEAT